MASQCLQVIAVLLAFIGWLGTIITCAMPMWKVSAFIGLNDITPQVIWEGLWMSCILQRTGQMQCKEYNFLLKLPQDIEVARAMVVTSVIVGVFGLLGTVVGGKCTNCMKDEVAKAKACMSSGVIFIIAAFLIIIPVSWSANTVTRDFYNPLVSMNHRKEFGAALYLGWASSVLLLLAGGLLCKSCPRKDDRPDAHAKFTASRTEFSTVNYV